MMQIVPRYRVDVKQSNTTHVFYVNGHIHEVYKTLSGMQFSPSGLEEPDSVTIVIQAREHQKVSFT